MFQVLFMYDNQKNYSSFDMTIEDIFQIPGRGLVVTGLIKKGTITVNTDIEICGLGKPSQKAAVKAIEAFHKEIDTATAGMNVGLVLDGVDKEYVEKGQSILIPATSSTKQHTGNILSKPTCSGYDQSNKSILDRFLSFVKNIFK